MNLSSCTHAAASWTDESCPASRGDDVEQRALCGVLADQERGS